MCRYLDQRLALHMLHEREKHRTLRGDYMQVEMSVCRGRPRNENTVVMYRVAKPCLGNGMQPGRSAMCGAEEKQGCKMRLSQELWALTTLQEKKFCG